MGLLATAQDRHVRCTQAEGLPRGAGARCPNKTQGRDGGRRERTACLPASGGMDTLPARLWSQST